MDKWNLEVKYSNIISYKKYLGFSVVLQPTHKVEKVFIKVEKGFIYAINR